MDYEDNMTSEDEMALAMEYLYDDILYNYSESDKGEVFDSYEID